MISSKILGANPVISMYKSNVIELSKMCKEHKSSFHLGNRECASNTFSDCRFKDPSKSFHFSLLSSVCCSLSSKAKNLILWLVNPSMGTELCHLSKCMCWCPNSQWLKCQYINWSHWGGVLIQHGSCPLKKRSRHTQTEHDVETGLKSNHCCQYLVLGLLLDVHPLSSVCLEN